jgi:hypothetical protein
MSTDSDYPPEETTGLPSLVMDELTCQVPDDTFGDEPILTFNGEEVWRASSVDAGDIRKVGVRRTFVDSAIVELFDEELAADDQLGSRVVEADEAGLGPRQAFFNMRPDARYILSYHVE